jgi:hypothetical protein
MAKKPEKPSPFSVVSGETAQVSPPRPLGSHGTALWNRIQAEYRIQDTGGIEILAQCCSSLDRAEDLAAAIARDGNVVYSRAGVPKTHPAVREELACRAFVVRTLERLGLNVEAIKPAGGQTRPFGWRPDVV